MPIPIPIPIGTTHVASVQGVVWKLVSCAYCRQDYAYLLELEATGEDHDLLFLEGEESAERARAKAAENFLRKSRNVVLPVPCPHCGSYQEDMTRMLKGEASINRLQIAGAVIGALAFIPLALNIPGIWVLTLVSATFGVALLAYGYVVAFSFDPNEGNPEARKEIGRKYALWGEELDEFLATNPHVARDAATGGSGDIIST